MRRMPRAPGVAELLALIGGIAALAACSAGPDAACPRSVICEPGASCFAPTCDAPTRCATGDEAALYGRAAAKDGGCVAVSDDACAHAATTCAVWGQCSAPPAGWVAKGACPAAEDDRDWLASRVPGCTGRGTCVALRDADCAAARVCGLEGRCVARDGVCVATRAEDCRESELCASIGRCTLDERGATCVAGGPPDCAGSRGCAGLGECGVARERCTTCERSDGCRAEGLCDLVEGTCRATSALACRRSVACRTEGRCNASKGVCVR